MRRHVPCRMCNGSGIRPSQDGIVPRVEVFMLSILRMFDEVRAAVWIPLTCIYMTRTQQQQQQHKPFIIPSSPPPPPSLSSSLSSIRFY